MSAEQGGKTGRKKAPWIRLFTDKWLWGSTSTELTLEQQAVFIRLLCLAMNGLGDVDITYPKTLAAQLVVPFDVLKSTLKRSEETGKIQSIDLPPERRQIARFLKWNHYQPDYLHRESDPSSRSHSSRENEDTPRIGGGEGAKIRPASAGGSLPSSLISSSKEGESEGEKDGLLPIPEGLPFKVRDELVERMGEIHRHARMVEGGNRHDGPLWLTDKLLRQEKRSFNNRVKDFTEGSKK